MTVVIVTTTSCEPASRVTLARFGPTRSQNAASRSGVRQYATTRSIAGTAARMHATCVSAWCPQPSTPSVAAPGEREVARGDAARGSRPQPTEVVGLDHGGELGARGVEDADDERHPSGVAT